MREATRYSNIIAIIDRLEADGMLSDHPAEALLATDPSGECAKKRYH